MSADVTAEVPALTRAFALVIERQGISRKTLAARLGVEPSTVSRYLSGRLSIPLESLPIVDELAGKPRGHVLRLAGFVDDEKPDVEAAIEADTAIADHQRDALVFLYNFFRTRSADT